MGNRKRISKWEGWSLLCGWVLDKVDAFLDVALEALGADFEEFLFLFRDAA